MKKARTVEIPDNRTVDFATYMKLNDHAYQSALFYATNYNKNSYQIKEKLLLKGYINDDLTVTYKDGRTETYNIIEETIAKLKEQYILDDEEYVLNTLQNGLDNGKSLQKLKSKLISSKIPVDMINKAIEEIEIDESYGLDKEANKIIRSSTFQKMDKYKRQQKMVRTLASKGFKIPEIYEWMNENIDIIEDEEE